MLRRGLYDGFRRFLMVSYAGAFIACWLPDSCADLMQVFMSFNGHFRVQGLQ